MGGQVSVPETRIPQERTFIVTGANTGIGYGTAKKIAQLGGRVIIACRNEQKANDAIEKMKKEIREETAEKIESEVPEWNIQYMNLDLSSLESTICFARKYRESGLPLHVLICNAGCLAFGKNDGFEIMFQVNYLSHFLLTLLLLPLLKESAPNSRIINVSSEGHKYSEFKLDNSQGQKSYSDMKFYGNSKLFQVMNTHSLSVALSGQGISVFSLHPGVVVTELFRRQLGAAGNVSRWMARIGGKYPDAGSKTSLIAALDPEYEGKSALYFMGGRPRNSSSLSMNEKKQELLWKYSLQCLREKLDDSILEMIGEKLETIGPLDMVQEKETGQS